jgi:hypothetical protein
VGENVSTVKCSGVDITGCDISVQGEEGREGRRGRGREKKSSYKGLFCGGGKVLQTLTY